MKGKGWAAVIWMIVVAPLTYLLNVGQLASAAQYQAAQERVASLGWNAKAIAPSGLSADAYLLDRAAERERHAVTHAFRNREASILIAVIAGGSVPCLLLALVCRRRAVPRPMR